MTRSQTALITGASQGIGEAIARHLAAEGFHLVLTARNTQKLEALKLSLSQQYPALTITIITCDTRHSEAVMRAAQTAQHAHGAIDVLINNAGVAPRSALFQELSIDDIDRTVDTNLKGVMYWIHALLPSMAEKQAGTIININSIAGETAYPYWAIYCASKFGLTALTESLAEEQRTNNIRVIGIHPGAVATDIWDSVDLAQAPNREGMLTADDIARSVVYALKQPQSVFINHLTITPLKPAL